jgi:hypothetical protein
MRVRRKRLLPLKRPTISAQEWEKINTQAEAAKELLEEERFAFLRDYLNQAQASITDYFVNNRIKKVQEVVSVTDSLKKILTTTRAEQEQELSGRYKFISELRNDLQRTASLPEDYLKAHEEGKISIEPLDEKDEEDL